MSIQESHVENHWVAPRPTQISPQLIKGVPRVFGELVVSPRNDCSPEATEPCP